MALMAEFVMQNRQIFFLFEKIMSLFLSGKIINKIPKLGFL
jgi:hypothetical protein